MERADLDLINKIMERAGAPRAGRMTGDGLTEMAEHFTTNLEQTLIGVFSHISYDVIGLLGRVISEYQPQGDDSDTLRTEAVRRTYRAIIGAHLAPPSERAEAMETARREIVKCYLATNGQLELLPA